MFDISRISEYREDNRLEAKKAAGGLPDSLWDTYSAFANTNGGMILLGVEELKDKSLKVVGVPNAEAQLKAFWDTVNNRTKVSVNILRGDNVSVEAVDGKSVIVINVPRAVRQDKPAYIKGNVYSGSYRRNGEGDYHCSASEVKNMVRDSGDITQDRLILDKTPMSVFCDETIAKYRTRFLNLKPKHVWANIPTEEFLLKIGAIKRSEEDNAFHPTVAGLLMFGYDYEILNEFPNYFLDYREKFGTEGERWSDRIVSSTGDWSGNVYDFYFRIQDKITSDLKIPFKLENGRDRIDDTPIHEAVREALTNALVHSDYYERRGLVVEKRKDGIVISNPGALRIAPTEALNGGVSDPRNGTMMLMLALVGIGERAGSGLANIRSVWKRQNWNVPKLQEQFNPDRTVLTLPLTENVGENDESVGENDENVGESEQNVGENDENVGVNGENVGVKLSKTEQQALELIMKNGELTQEAIGDRLNRDKRTIERVMRKLRENGLIERIGSDRQGVWRIIRHAD
ncbi:MAG: putative DNA binding domain-containing protein [Clostridiales bacterium]|jgi:predicted HTH transcriptional regulator|nr:putative DNA binding domain-containing protein [Clostridiales bacterium]